ncbi:MAG TPA: TIR domain-containing protein [Thermoanaerobaculia bacterium]|nr:TIR domain-containing protein [Thermoanaerobaculia bacterium]
MPTPTRRFRIALSFPGEHRPFVGQVAEHLSAAVGRERMLYDQYYESEFARVDLDTHLQRLYHDESELIAVFLCADYERKDWCGLEWRAIRDLIKRRQVSSVMPLRFDNTEIPGLFSTDGYIWIGERSPKDIADRILERWQRDFGLPAAQDTAPDPPVEPKWTDELRIYGESFVGRQEELTALDRAWATGVRIFALHAEGGAGKTRGVVEWLRRMRDAGWRGARRVFVHSFYSQGSGERRNATSELFFEQALAYFGYQGAPILQADEKGRTLARLLVEHHGLLVLDGFEPLQHPTQHAERGRLKDPGIARLLLSLASVAPGGTPGLCLITSRQPVVELRDREGATVVQQSLDLLHRDDGAALLRQFQIAGPAEELKKASDEFRGHAYSLMLLGSYLKTATDQHDIRRRREVVLLDEDPEHGNHARHMFAAYVEHLGENSSEVAVLRLLGFFDRAAERQLLDVLRAREGVVYEWSEEAKPADRRAQPKRIEDALPEVTASLLDLPQTQWLRVLNRLRELRLIDLTGPEKSPALDAHPLLRECFAEQVRSQFPAAWQAGHRRLFEHLGGTIPYWPKGIEGLQPLYQAVAHGCRAGLHEQARADIYLARILRGMKFYSIHELGAFGADLGAVACFFTRPWTTPAPALAPAAQAWLLDSTAFCLRALGRLSEAVEPMRAGLDMHVQEEDWRQAAISANNLGELELTRGEVTAAVTAGEQAVTYADRSGDEFQQIARRAMLAEALHQAGRRDESRPLFEEAESRQAANQPVFPRLLTSRQGFRYGDFLLSEAERAAWRRWLRTETGPSEMLTTTTARDAVSDRAAYALRIAEANRWLLDIALDHLTLARAAFYKGQPARDHIDAAVNGLRAAGTMDHLPRGLLTRAWQRCRTGDEAGARADLDEAWEIAERGPMPLFQADIQLTRARLFRDRAALAEARRLIEKHGYHRRGGELVDAEAAADGPDPWPLSRGSGEGVPAQILAGALRRPTPG